jgi:hypothetical protein
MVSRYMDVDAGLHGVTVFISHIKAALGFPQGGFINQVKSIDSIPINSLLDSFFYVKNQNQLMQM